MLILVHCWPSTLRRRVGHHPNAGVLSSPRKVYPDACSTYGFAWAADNDAYGAWNERKWLRMLERIEGEPGCLFVTCPDVVGDAAATAELFGRYRQRIVDVGHPVGFVAQDGLTEVPWDELDALFVGGTTEFKLGPVAAAVVAEARRRNVWVHMGRVNTRNRIRYAKSLGVDSIDGTNFSMFGKTTLPWALTWAASEQLWPA